MAIRVRGREKVVDRTFDEGAIGRRERRMQRHLLQPVRDGAAVKRVLQVAAALVIEWCVHLRPLRWEHTLPRAYTNDSRAAVDTAANRECLSLGSVQPAARTRWDGECTRPPHRFDPTGKPSATRAQTTTQTQERI